MFGFLKLPEINKGVEEYKITDKAVLLDVRDKEEYDSGHIPGAINIPRDEIDRALEQIPDRNTPVFCYCYSGRRSDIARAALKQMGFLNVKNIGGIVAYKGELEKAGPH